MLDLYLKAWSVVLDEARLRKAGTSQSGLELPDQERHDQDMILQRTLKLAETLQTCVVQRDAASSITVSWVIYVALQSLLRCQRRQALWERSPTIIPRQQNLAIQTANKVAHAVEEAASVTIKHALMMDSIDALQHMLTHLGRDSPIAIFFLGKLEKEKRLSAVELDKCLVGLINLASGR
jgi:hypothetical protein